MRHRSRQTHSTQSKPRGEQSTNEKTDIGKNFGPCILFRKRRSFDSNLRASVPLVANALQPESTPGARLSIARGLSTNYTAALSTTQWAYKGAYTDSWRGSSSPRETTPSKPRITDKAEESEVSGGFFAGRLRASHGELSLCINGIRSSKTARGGMGMMSSLLHRRRKVPSCVGFRLELRFEVGEFAMCRKRLGALGELLAPQPGNKRSRRMPCRQTPVLEL